MVKLIKTDKRLAPHLRDKIEDAGISVEISDSLSEEEYAVIKVDDYYSCALPGQEPKAVDFVVVVDCQCSSFFMYILELKNYKRAKRLDFKEITEKFKNTIDMFLSDTFKEIFLNDKFKYKGVKLYLISDAYGLSKQFPSYEEYKKLNERLNKKDTLRVDLGLSSKVFKFKGKLYKIDYEIPPNPVITRHT